MNHESKCAHLHGHNYVVYLEAETLYDCRKELDSVGRIVDFSVIKDIYDPWIQQHWDHGFILFAEDSEAIKLLSGFDTGTQQQKLFLFGSNPTAENLASFLMHDDYFKSRLAGYDVALKSVTVHETENCSAVVVRDHVQSQ